MRLLLFSLFLSVWAHSAIAERRLAFVVGNSDYENGGVLTNPINDAWLISKTLESVGFEVTTYTNLTRNGFSRAFSDFLSETSLTDITFFYFAGHGMQLDGTNYLLATDASLQSEFDVISEGLSLQDISEVLRRRSMASLIFLDACRDNPLADRFYAENFSQSRSVATRGLAAVSTTKEGTMLVFAASPGQVAYDGLGANSPFSLALARHIPTPGVEVLSLMKRVIGDVRRLTNGRQSPTITNDLAQEIYLGRERAARETPVVPSVDKDNRLAVALPRNSAPASSPLITACDALAADPEDGSLPPGVDGVFTEALDAALAISACRIAVSGHPDHARSHYQLGRALLANGDRARAIDSYRRSTELGLAIAQSRLGRALIESSDRDQALEGAAILEAVADQGDGAAAIRLAAFYSNPNSPARGAAVKAQTYLRLAARAGDVGAMHQIGLRLLSQTLASDRERREGVDWLERAAETGHVDAQLRLAMAYLQDGALNQPSRGVRWLESAAEEGEILAMRRLVSLYSDGETIPKDEEKAALWMEALAESGDVRYALWTGYNYEVGVGVQRDPNKAAKHYFLALRAGDATLLRRRTDDWPSETAKALQQRLRLDPLYRDIDDGIIGPRTRQAMARLCDCTTGSANARLVDMLPDL